MIRNDPQEAEDVVLALPYQLFDGRHRELRVSLRPGRGGIPYSATVAQWDVSRGDDPKVLGYVRLTRDEVRAVIDALAPLAQ